MRLQIIIRRCEFCRSEMDVTAREYRENQYCNGCLNERLRLANEEFMAKHGPTHWEQIGDSDYSRLVKDDGTPFED